MNNFYLFHMCVWDVNAFRLYIQYKFTFENIESTCCRHKKYFTRRLCWSATAWVGCLSPSVYLSVCPEHKSKTNEPKEFKLGTGNGLGISYKWHGFGFSRSQDRVRVTVTVYGNTAWLRTLWVPSSWGTHAAAARKNKAASESKY